MSQFNLENLLLDDINAVEEEESLQERNYVNLPCLETPNKCKVLDHSFVKDPIKDRVTVSNSTVYSQSSTYKRRTPAKVPDTLGMLPDRNSLKPEEFEDLDDDNPNTPANRHPNGSKSEITMKIKRRSTDAHDSVYVTLTFEEEDEDPEDKQTFSYVLLILSRLG